MWKLTIKQDRKSDSSDYTFKEEVTFFSDDLSELTMLIERMAHCKEACETTYKIEKVGENNESL